MCLRTGKDILYMSKPFGVTYFSIQRSVFVPCYILTDTPQNNYRNKKTQFLSASEAVFTCWTMSGKKKLEILSAQLKPP